MEKLNLQEIAIDLLIINENFNSLHPSRKNISNFKLETFTQVWGNTSGGFDGIGGSAITEQRTYVFVPNDDDMALVFFGRKFAYYADCCAEFINDLNNKQLVGVSKCYKYDKGKQQ